MSKNTVKYTPIAFSFLHSASQTTTPTVSLIEPAVAKVKRVSVVAAVQHQNYKSQDFVLH
jgi:hypothetical protein